MGVLHGGIHAAVAEPGHEVCEGSAGLRCKNLVRMSKVVDSDVCSPHVSQRFGDKGLQLAGAPAWIPDAFNGAFLLIAVGLAGLSSASVRPLAASRFAGIRRLFHRGAHGH